LIKIGAVIKLGSLFQAQISHIHTDEETIYDFTLLGDVQGCWFAKPLLLVMPLYEDATQWKDTDKNREEPSTQKQNSVEVEHQFRTSPPLPLEKFSEFCNLHITHFSLHISDQVLPSLFNVWASGRYSDGFFLSCWWKDPLLFTLEAGAGYDY
jgi:hypothetical protein